ncbi:MAG TPA: serine/threonine-protein kinase [Segeticoccus sp.]|jgi:serine/threonine protein kinase|nr:serine/threonine-protein kinase [Segeticoccus sp.]
MSAATVEIAGQVPTALPLPDGYDALEHLARSEYLDVWSVWSHERGCPAVAKVLRPDRLGDRSARARLVAEGRHLLGLAHPHLVRAYELGEVPEPVLVLETLTGETLGHLVERRTRRLSCADLAELGRQLCSVVGYLHRRGLLHLDLKPSNVVVESGRVRLLDLSHAREPGRCRAGYGTWEYMPPEQLLGGAVTTASDVYGIGAVLYRGATLLRPFGHDRGSDDVRVDAGPLRRRSLPVAFRELVLGCLAQDPADRPTLGELATTLDRVA